MSSRTRHLVVQAALVVIAVAAYLLLPNGVVRAILTAPTLFWVPGRSILALLRVTRSAGKWTAPLAVLASLITLVAAALAVHLVAGTVPLGVLPIALSIVTLPLNLLAGEGPRPRLPIRYAAAFTVAVIAAGGLLWTVSNSLPSQPASQYLELAFSGPYATVSGTVPVTAGQVLHVPVSVTAEQTDLNGLSVDAEVGGKSLASAPVTVTGDNSATASIEVPAQTTGCLNKVSFVLHRGTAALRSVDLYLQSGGNCAHS